jgi:hypothetical protein
MKRIFLPSPAVSDAARARRVATVNVLASDAKTPA